MMTSRGQHELTFYHVMLQERFTALFSSECLKCSSQTIILHLLIFFKSLFNSIMLFSFVRRCVYLTKAGDDVVLS